MIDKCIKTIKTIKKYLNKRKNIIFLNKIKLDDFSYKIINNTVNVGPIERIRRAHRIGRNDHNMKMYVPFAKTDYFKNSFYIRTANEWNMLPSNVINNPSLSTFKISLKSYLHI